MTCDWNEDYQVMFGDREESERAGDVYGGCVTKEEAIELARDLTREGYPVSVWHTCRWIATFYPAHFSEVLG